ncbi:MAG: insulinase family protein [Crocinitomicaceae bacterium]|jgi:zinc protease|nr:insulinase family protein [Crocinitomicaceae bacterium]MDP4722700.1 insulinase family protein [Crocinitomicaceae bacterium]MDP4739152.1 insulinase family protein [Crocinitomicaceae bacterium]MDP4807289.1 insulinase family protein [Crocinitomicaceae bacterium]MDP4867597.1 insulinase family protein [Crocinitomicaceae bacterium]
MIAFERFTLANGLRVLFHKEPATPMAVVNVLYDVGARDESPEQTGFAHLFEHLMFGGSKHIADFDAPLQAAGGQSNAFTSNDITNYYDVLPAHNLDTALWLESDRMLSLAFTPKSLEVQRQVVIEEFKQRYLNQPYGDAWLQLRPLAYQKHPYRWATIGKNIKHIEDATMDDVRAFFKKHYHPGNAILCIVGNFELATIKEKVAHYFGNIPAQAKSPRQLTAEPPQQKFRIKTIQRKVPAGSFYYAFKMGKRLSDSYYLADLLSDHIGNEKTGILYTELQRKKRLVSEITAYITGSIDEGLFVITGKLNPKRTFEELEAAIWPVLAQIKDKKMSKSALQQLILKLRTAKAFQDQGLLNRAMNLSFFELLDAADLLNTESARYEQISTTQLQQYAQELLDKNRCSLLQIQPK